jgi:DNA processing protein
MEDLAAQIDLSQLLNTESSAEKVAPNVVETAQNDDNTRLLDAMGYDPVSIDQLVVQTGLTPAALSSMLLVMELQGLIAANGRGSYTRIRE